jgi:hypothetical protein
MTNDCNRLNEPRNRTIILVLEFAALVMLVITALVVAVVVV